jgi:hypothetical protein
MYYRNETKSLQRSRVGIGKQLTILDLSCHILYRKQCKLMRKQMGTDFWRCAIEKEMKNVMPAFEKWDDGTIEDIENGKKLIGYKGVFCHIVFDIKVDFTRKARFVVDGSKMVPPSSITYASVVSRDSV